MAITMGVGFVLVLIGAVGTPILIKEITTNQNFFVVFLLVIMIATLVTGVTAIIVSTVSFLRQRKSEGFRVNPTTGEPKPTSVTVLVFGIVGLVCSLFVSGFTGLLFSSIGLDMVSNYKKGHSIIDGKAKAGNVLSIIGMIIGSVVAVSVLITFTILTVSFI